METNLYDQPAQARFINTYVPIDFGELYRIGSAQKQVVDEARKELSTNLQKWSEFQSPSTIDTENFYKLSTGTLAPLIEEMASNPDLIKTAEYRSKLQSAINSLDYSSLSMLRESADMQRQGMQIRAKMKAEGRLKDSWDLSDIANYDTLGQKKVFSDLTPIRYMTANELSTPYYNDLKPGFLGTEFKDGIKYIVTGNNMKDLYDVATAHYNDLIDTPQGQMYLRDFKKQGMNDEQAQNAFINMIAQSQIDRTIRPQYTPDPYWAQLNLLERKLSAKKGDVQQADLNRYTQKLNRSAQNDVVARVGGLTQEEFNALQSGQDTDNVISNKVVTNTINNVRTVFNAGLSSQGFRKGVQNVISVLSSPLSPYGQKKLGEEGATKTIGGNMYETSSTSNMVLASDFAVRKLAVDGVDNATSYAKVFGNQSYLSPKKQSALNKLRLMWENDDFKGVVYSAEPVAVTDYDGLYSYRKVYIPTDQLRNMTEDEKKLAGKWVKGGDLIRTLKQTVTAEGNVAGFSDRTMGEFKEKDEAKMSMELIDTRKYYVEVPALYANSLTGEQAHTRDNEYDKYIGLQSKMRTFQTSMSEVENELDE